MVIDDGRVPLAPGSRASHRAAKASRPKASIPRADRDLPAWLGVRHRRLPLWAQEEISDLRSAEINRDFSSYMTEDVRRTARKILGGNCTFADDDLHLLAGMALRAIGAGLTDDLAPSVAANIATAAQQRADASAIEARSGETEGLDPKGESAAPKEDAQ